MSDPVSVLPVTWRKISNLGPAGAAYASLDGLRVIVTDTEPGDHSDGRAWRHISLSRANRMPTYEDIISVKELFAGREEKAVMVFPARSKHVNIHQYCLHLFRCLDGDPLPEFSRIIDGSRSL